MYNRAFPVGNTLFLSISWRNCVKLTQFLLVRSKQGLGQARPNKITSKLARVADVKSRWNTRFSRIENLWPRDGSCPLPLRSKRIFNKCFRIVKTQKTSRGCSAHVMGSPFAPNEVPAPVCAAALSGSLTESVRSWHSISFRRLM